MEASPEEASTGFGGIPRAVASAFNPVSGRQNANCISVPAAITASRGRCSPWQYTSVLRETRAALERTITPDPAGSIPNEQGKTLLGISFARILSLEPSPAASSGRFPLTGAPNQHTFRHR